MSIIKQLTPRDKNDIRPSLPIKERKDAHCNHDYLEIDKDERILRCETCNAVIDPFDFAMMMAHEERKQYWTLQELKREIELLKGAKDRLEKDVTNLKSSKRRITHG